MTKTKEKVIKTMTLHFIMDGEFITEQSRMFWIDKRCDIALEMLMCMDPMNEALAIQILSGKKKLVGQTVCDNPDCCQCKGKIPMHLENDNAKLPSLFKMFKTIREDGEELHKELSEVVNKSPYLMTPEDMLKVLDSAIRTMHGISTQDKSYMTERVADLKEELEEGDDEHVVHRSPRLTPQDNDHLAKVMERMEKQADEVTRPVKPDHFELSTGWLSPEGDWYSGDYMAHNFIAQRISELNCWGSDGEKELEKRGWIKVGVYLIGDGNHSVMFGPSRGDDNPLWKKGPTEAQKKALKICFKKHKVNIFNYESHGPITFEQWLEYLKEERDKV